MTVNSFLKDPYSVPQTKSAIMTAIVDRDKRQQRVNGFERSFAICAGSTATTAFLTPFEVVKTRMQAQFSINTCQRPMTFLGWLRHITHTEGTAGLYRGFAAFMLQLTPNNLIYFWSYEITRDYLIESSVVNPTWAPMFGGVLARTLATYAVAPFELIKVQFQSGHLSKETSIFNALRQNSQRGLLNLWRGVGPTLWRDVPFSAIYWFFYEDFKKRFSSGVNLNLESAYDRFYVSFFAGAIAGTAAGFVVTPFDVVKTLRQAQVESDGTNKSTMRTLQKLWGQGKVSAVFAGLGPRLLRVPPGCAIMISSYELTKYAFGGR